MDFNTIWNQIGKIEEQSIGQSGKSKLANLTMQYLSFLS